MSDAERLSGLAKAVSRTVLQLQEWGADEINLTANFQGQDGVKYSIYAGWPEPPEPEETGT